METRSRRPATANDAAILSLFAELEACQRLLIELEPERIRRAELAAASAEEWPAELTYSFRDADGEMRTARMSPEWIDRHARTLALDWLSGDHDWAKIKKQAYRDHQSRLESVLERLGVTAIEREADAIGKRVRALREAIISSPAAGLPAIAAKAKVIAMLFGGDPIDLGGESSELRLATSIVADLLQKAA